MKVLNSFCILSVLVCTFGIINGCAIAPSNRDDVKSDLENGKYEDAYRKAEFPIAHHSKHSFDYVPLFKEQYPQSLPHIVNYYHHIFDNNSTKGEVFSSIENIDAARKVGLISDEDYHALMQYISEQVVLRLHNKTFPIVLTDSYQVFQPPLDEDNQAIIFQNSVDLISNTLNIPLAEAVFHAALQKGTQSPEFDYLSKHLSELLIPADQLTGDFEKLFPDEVKLRRERSHVRLKLVGTSKDDDDYISGIIEYLENNHHIEITDNDKPGTYTATIHKIRFHERELQEHTETIRYQQSEVNILAAALLMPKNASYFFDLHTGGYSISYDFRVTLTYNGKQLFEDNFQGNQKSTYSYCDDARIQNVFGGTSSAEFTANRDMDSRCASNSHSVDEQKVYDNTLANIGSQISSMKPIVDQMTFGILPN